MHLDLLSDRVSNCGLESVQLGGFGLQHLIVLLLLSFHLLADPVEQGADVVKLRSGLTLLRVEAVSQILDHGGCCGRLVCLCRLHIGLQRVQSALQPFNPLLVLIRSTV